MELTGLPTETDIKNMHAMQKFFVFRAKQFEIDFHNKKSQTEQATIILAILVVLQLILFVILWYYFSRGYIMGTLSLALLTIIYMSIFLIRFNVVKQVMKPENDPGIVIWYFCCLRVG